MCFYNSSPTPHPIPVLLFLVFCGSGKENHQKKQGFLGTGQASIIILSVKNALLPPRPQDEKTYPEVVSRSMPRTLKDFCQRACSQKIRRAPLEKKIRTAQVCGLCTVRIFFARFCGLRTVRKIVVGPVLRFLYRPYFLFFKPPPCHKSSSPPR